MKIKQMNNEETRKHLLKWCEENHGPFSWPTDACGYDQHIRFAKHRNEHWYGGDFKKFVQDYANSLTEQMEGYEQVE
jgi:hypothetical protein